MSVSSLEITRPRGHLKAMTYKSHRARADSFPRIKLESLISFLENSLFKFYFSKMKSYFLQRCLSPQINKTYPSLEEYQKNFSGRNEFA